MVGNRLMHGYAEPMAHPKRTEHPGVSSAPATEPEIASHVHSQRARMARNQEVNKGIRLHSCQRIIEGQPINAMQSKGDERGVSAVGRLKSEGLRRNPPEETGGMGLKRHGDGVCSHLPRICHCCIYEAPMS